MQNSYNKYFLNFITQLFHYFLYQQIYIYVYLQNMYQLIFILLNLISLNYHIFLNVIYFYYDIIYNKNKLVYIDINQDVMLYYKLNIYYIFLLFFYMGYYGYR